MARSQKISTRVNKVTFCALCLAPLIWVMLRLVRGELGANPAEHANHKLGLIALRLLTANLIWGSLIALGRIPRLLKGYGYLRRHLGVITFVYLVGHLAFYFLREGDAWIAAVQMLTKTYLILGLAAFAIMLILTITSTDRAVRFLRARWKPLHRLVYLGLLLSVIHFQLIEKKDWTEAWPYLGPTLALYLIRLGVHARTLRRRPAR